MKDKQVQILERALAREKAARKAAEQILEEKSRELYFKSEELEKLNTRLESLVKEKTSQLKGVFENIVDAYAVMNLVGDVLKMNEAAEKLLGYTIKDGINLMQLVHPEEQEKVGNVFAALLEDGAVTDFQVKIVIADQSERLVHINASLIYDENESPIAAQGIVRDITDIKAAEQNLIDSENRLTTLIANLDSAVLLENEHRNIVITNHRFCEFFQIPLEPSDLIGQNCENAAEQSKGLFKDPEGFVAKIDELITKKELVIGDVLWLNDGRVLERDFIPIYENGAYKGHLWSYTDVTVKIKFRESLEAQKEKYSNIIANMNLGLIEVNTEDEVLMVNHSFENMSGYREEELIGQKANELLLFNGEQQKLVEENRKRLKGLSNSYEIVAKTKEGEKRHWLISGATNYDLQGRIIGSIGIHLDITKLKELEIQKEKLLLKLEKSNEELQEYAHIVSHDLKSPLRSIDALVSWLKEDNKGKLDEVSEQNLSLIQTTLEKMELLISDVLNYSSVGADNTITEKVNVHYLVQDLVPILYVPDHIEIKVLNPLPTVLGDKTKLQQVFQNLISNAIKFNDKSLGFVEIDVVDQDNHYVFSIKDNGIGIETKFQDKIFKIFNTLNKRKDSTGIGLSIVKKIVNLHEGEIWVESNPGDGATFFFTLKK